MPKWNHVLVPNWKRAFMHAEYLRRKGRISEKRLRSENVYLREHVAYLKSKLLIHRVDVVLAGFRMLQLSDDEEECPLALAPIKNCPPPFERCERIFPSCIELTACGHRFNSDWILWHLFKKSTLRCPVCRRGQKRFKFSSDCLPPQMAALARKAGAIS